jgi:hypothetical protein
MTSRLSNARLYHTYGPKRGSDIILVDSLENLLQARVGSFAMAAHAVTRVDSICGVPSSSLCLVVLYVQLFHWST